MKICTKIEIPSTPKAVWEVLTLFEEYPQWNPFMVTIRGQFRKREFLHITQKSNRTKRVIKVKVLKAVNHRKIEWLESSFIFGIQDGQHIIRLSPISNDRCLVEQEVTFSGVKVAWSAKSLRTFYEKGLEEMNQALAKVLSNQ